MKKILLIITLVLTLLVAGCSSNNEYKNVSVDKIKNSVESSGLLLNKPFSTDIVDFDYFNDVKEDITEGFVIRAAMNVRLEDIIVIKTENPDKIYSSLESYKEDMIMRPFGHGYGAEENAKIASDTIIEKKGNYVYLISAEKASDIQELILKSIKK